MKDNIIKYLQKLDLTQFVLYDSNNNLPIDKNTGKCLSYSFSYEEIEFGEYTITLSIDAEYQVDVDGYYELIKLYCDGDVRNSYNDIFMSKQDIQPHLNII